MSAREHLVLAFRRAYGVEVKSLVRRRTVVGVVAEDGSHFIWKPLNARDDEERLSALAGLRPVFESAGTEAALPLPTLSGGYVLEVGSGLQSGYLQKWVTGRHVDASSLRERHAVLSSLGRVHRRSQICGFPAWSTLQRGTLLHKLRLKERAVSRIWAPAEVACPALRGWKARVEGQMRYVLRRYAAYLAECRDDVQHAFAFCHRDLAPHNVMYQGADEVAWIDFDHANYDDMLHDPMQFISHCTYLAQMSAEEYYDLHQRYAESANLTATQASTLWTLTMWPDILVRTLLEWTRAGCREEGLTRVHYALTCERRKLAYRSELGLNVERLDA
ncbi:phosphotransferase [Alicyclobacillus fastidiosus]|uniref:Phosphotransferase n=1 Tax=Alicyclobacillus fastidiosus TaxID=392011 RepID=A0ABV5AIH8_9BACL|nr:phosphotransferase [Alicyclobacillus fastidiosus]WEH11195.1 phosphotransferase [Alicyclobacillus fastidiosus]